MPVCVEEVAEEKKIKTEENHLKELKNQKIRRRQSSEGGEATSGQSRRTITEEVKTSEKVRMMIFQLKHVCV